MKFHAFRNFVIGLVLLAFLTPAHAGMVSTSEALKLEAGAAQAKVAEYFLREEVAAELASFGVSPEMALARVQAMSPEELETLAGRIDETPAGAGTVITVLGITFLVLLILHLTGVLRVFNR